MVVVNVVLVFVVMMVVVVMVVMILVVMVVLVIVVLVVVPLQLQIFAGEKARKSHVTRAFDFGKLNDFSSGDGAEGCFSGDVGGVGGGGGDGDGGGGGWYLLSLVAGFETFV